MPLCKRDSAWFDAILKNDLVFVQNNLEKYQRQYESRSKGAGIRQGWAGIHYAVELNHDQIFEALFPYEFDLLTDKPTELYCPFLDRPASLDSGSSIIHIALTTNNVKVLQYVFKQWVENPEYGDLAGVKNDSGQSGLLVCPVVNTDAAMLWATNERVIRNEITSVTNKDQNFVMMVAMMGRVAYAELIKDFIGEQAKLNIDVQIEQLKETIQELMESLDDEEQGWRHYGEQEADQLNYKTFTEEKQKVIDILAEVEQGFEDSDE
ncbi:Conserved_hypothetical protein [Hexamita inflata]|uniref:Uncharacterized protein n=1 Tax=Hexamita inflata TaxID=28002 RepID=A0AA86PQ06_9EUKA|nr:Conserved hypothetical protein [Hexamita inflata]